MLELRGRSCLVVGGGHVAREKVAGLVAQGASVRVVAPSIVAELDALASRTPELTLVRRPFEPGDLDGCWFVVAATDDPAVQQQVYDEATARRIFVNGADDPARCSAYLTAVHREGPVVVSVSTEGTSPALAAWLRDRLAGALPPGIAGVAEQLAAERRLGRRSREEWRQLIEALVEQAAATR